MYPKNSHWREQNTEEQGEEVIHYIADNFVKGLEPNLIQLAMKRNKNWDTTKDIFNDKSCEYNILWLEKLRNIINKMDSNISVEINTEKYSSKCLSLIINNNLVSKSFIYNIYPGIF